MNEAREMWEKGMLPKQDYLWVLYEDFQEAIMNLGSDKKKRNVNEEIDKDLEYIRKIQDKARETERMLLEKKKEFSERI